MTGTDGHTKPSIHGILIPGARGRLLATLYTAGGDGPHPTVLLLHGIPGIEQNLDLAQKLRQAGFHVLAFHYSGCWGSDGDYSLIHNLEDANTVLDYICSDRRFSFDTRRIYAVGHSLGGYVCGQLAARRPEVKAAVLLFPCDIGRLSLLRREAPDSAERICAVLEESAGWLQGTSGAALIQDALSLDKTGRLDMLAPRLAQKPVLVLGAALDQYTPPGQHCAPLETALRAAGAPYRSIRLETDHFGSDKRDEIIESVGSFLCGQAGHMR